MSRKIKSSSHSDELVAGVAKLLSTQKLADLQLKVGGKIFHCHKLILALKSPYIEKRFQAVAVTEEIALNDVLGDAFDKVLQFIYTGETELTDKNVENILRASNLMELTELTMFCVDFLTDRLSIDTCSRYWKLAEQMDLAALAVACKRLCVKEFGKISPSSDLSSLSEKMMIELLEDDELVVESEVDVCEALMRWLNLQSQPGNQVQLLTRIRWSGIPVEYVKTKLLTNSILMKDQKSFEFLSKVISYRLTGMQFHGLNTFHRPSTGVEQCVIIVGLDAEDSISSDVLRVSLQSEDDVTCIQAIPTGMNCESAACVSGNQLYVTGAGSEYTEAWKWESLVGWTRCADMIEGRRRHCATFVNNISMYVLGGFDEENTLDCIEQYNTLTNKWTTVGRLTHAAESAACAVYKTSIYVFGGCGQNDVNLDSVQMFDTTTKLCTILTQRLPQPERLLRAVMWDKSVILINDRTCLIFDLEQQTFQQRDQFAVGVTRFGVVLENQRIFIIGGVGSDSTCNVEHLSGDNDTDSSCDDEDDDSDDDVDVNMVDEIKSVAVMDIINDQTTPNWIQIATLPSSCAVDAFSAITLPI